ncbi:MAG: glucose-6-phosphate isomerase [Burkholderiales bacterium]|nr:glucose-6-phosphate isomerase [Burkholderiales bacterium]
MNPTQFPAWSALARRTAAAPAPSYGALARKPAQELTVEAAGLRADLSRHWLADDTLPLLLELAEQAELPAWRQRLFDGAAINVTEQRRAGHTALRSDAEPALVAARGRMLALAEALRAGTLRGATGAPIDTVVCCGIGGSDLGPRLVTEALGPPSGAARLHFVANIDPVELAAALAQARPERTLVVAISKSFTTMETLANTRAALRWLHAAGLAPERQLYAITAAPARAQAFGVPAAQVLDFPDWVGGRYSLWSPCGLPIALAHGGGAFDELLAGAAALDAHFLTAPLARNLPALLGLLGVLYINFHGLRTRAVFAYAQRLRYLAPYLQQLEMESLGKRVSRDGAPLGFDTSAVVWGDVGTPAQHSVFQFLHQGTQVAPVDFITCAAFEHSADERERLLYASALAQADALAGGDAVLGTDASNAAEPLRCPGGRPSSFIAFADFSPRSLGALLALFEHRTFVQSVIWGINAFDQFGVEIGKKLLSKRLPGQ